LKLDCLFTVQSLLNERFATLFASGTNLSAAQTLHTLVLTATSDSLDGFWAQIQPFYEPLTPTFQSKVRTLNDSIVSGDVTPADFAEYVKLLAASLLAA
jgi:hypothetical protein